MTTSEPIIVEKTFSATPEKIWQALTNKEQMKLWYFDLAEFKPERGFEFWFKGGDESRTFTHICQVTEVIEQKKLAYSWRYEGYEGDSLVTFELFPEGERTRLKLTHSGLETYPANEPALGKANFVKGWNHIIGNSLQDFLKVAPVINQ